MFKAMDRRNDKNAKYKRRNNAMKNYLHEKNDHKDLQNKLKEEELNQKRAEDELNSLWLSSWSSKHPSAKSHVIRECTGCDHCLSNDGIKKYCVTVAVDNLK